MIQKQAMAATQMNGAGHTRLAAVDEEAASAGKEFDGDGGTEIVS